MGIRDIDLLHPESSTRGKWKVRMYYNDTVKYPKNPGELALETVHSTDSSKDIEVSAAERRKDIGVIQVIQIGS